MNRRIFAIGALMLALSACETAPSISSDVTPGTNFANYRTYQWVEIAPGPGMNPVTLERMRQGVESAMASKGYAKAATGDLTLIMTVGGKERVDIQTWGRFGQNVDTYRYTEGKLALDAFDTRTARPVWHGEAVQTIDPGRIEPALIDAAVAGVITQFPARG